MKHLIQLLLPLTDGAGRAIPHRLFREVRETLVERHGGLTAYNRAPAKGLWKDEEEEEPAPTVQDEIIVYEVLVDGLDERWWARYREKLASDFGQKELLIRAHPVQLL